MKLCLSGVWVSLLITHLTSINQSIPPMETDTLNIVITAEPTFHEESPTKKKKHSIRDMIHALKEQQPEYFLTPEQQQQQLLQSQEIIIKREKAPKSPEKVTGPGFMDRAPFGEALRAVMQRGEMIRDEMKADGDEQQGRKVSLKRKAEEAIERPEEEVKRARSESV
jgi:hypothetical protein